jgi:uncharacterized membrane-anchored protein YjiN (DUF445 family)
MNEIEFNTLTPEKRAQAQMDFLQRAWSTLENDDRFKRFDKAAMKREAEMVVEMCSDGELLDALEADVGDTDLLEQVWTALALGVVRTMIKEHIQKLVANYRRLMIIDVYIWDFIVMYVLDKSKWCDVPDLLNGGPEAMARWNDSVALRLACRCVARAEAVGLTELRNPVL